MYSLVYVTIVAYNYWKTGMCKFASGRFITSLLPS